MVSGTTGYWGNGRVRFDYYLKIDNFLSKTQHSSIPLFQH